MTKDEENIHRERYDTTKKEQSPAEIQQELWTVAQKMGSTRNGVKIELKKAQLVIRLERIVALTSGFTEYRCGKMKKRKN